MAQNRLALFFGACIVCASASNTSSSDVDICETLYLLNFVPYPDDRPFAGWDRGFELIPAGHLAAKHINSNPDILPGYRLEVIDVRSEACGLNTIVDGVTQYHKHLFSSESVNPMCVLGIVGLYCSTVTNTIAPIANNRNLGYVQLAASTSPLHRNTTLLPYTFHIIVSSRVFNEAMIALMRNLTWRRLNIVYSSEGFYFRTTATDLFETVRSELSRENSSYSLIEIFEKESLSGLVDLINREETRIGYFTLTNSGTAKILCEAHDSNLLERYHFIFHERTLSEIFSALSSSESIAKPCTEQTLTEALESIYLLHYRLHPPNHNQMLMSGITYEKYVQELRLDGLILDSENLYANSLYDQVWALASAATRTLDKLQFLNTSINATKIVKNRDILAEALRAIEFNGSSGLIRFGEKQEVQTQVDIFKVSNRQTVLIGRYDPYKKTVTFEADFNKSSLPQDSFETHYALLQTWLGSLVILCSVILTLLTLFNIIAMLQGRS